MLHQSPSIWPDTGGYGSWRPGLSAVLCCHWATAVYLHHHQGKIWRQYATDDGRDAFKFRVCYRLMTGRCFDCRRMRNCVVPRTRVEAGEVIVGESSSGSGSGESHGSISGQGNQRLARTGAKPLKLFFISNYFFLQKCIQFFRTFCKKNWNLLNKFYEFHWHRYFSMNI